MEVHERIISIGQAPLRGRKIHVTTDQTIAESTSLFLSFLIHNLLLKSRFKMNVIVTQSVQFSLVEVENVVSQLVMEKIREHHLKVWR